MAKRLVVIDGKSVFYRGYFAMPNLANTKGLPTGGVYGFATMALRILKELKPDYVIIAWDKSKTNIRARRKLYQAYKANRKPMPDDMRVQIPYLRRLLAGFNWPLLECDDFEADDIMATLAVKARQKGLETILVTSDLDVLQAVNGETSVCVLKKGLTNVVMYTRNKFTEEYGMTPEQFIDYKALRGDSSDNVPGVGGVGDKTAKDLVQKFSTLEDIYKHIGKIPETLRQKLEKDKDMAFLSHKLLEIQTNAPVLLDLKEADVLKANPTVLQQLFSELNFRRLKEELPNQMKIEQSLFNREVNLAKNIDTKVIEIKEPADLELLKQANSLMFYTIVEHNYDTQLPDVKELIISKKHGQAYIIRDQEILSNVPELIKNKKIIGFDLKRDLKAWRNLECNELFDIMIAEFLINPLMRYQSLGQAAESELGIPNDNTFDGNAPIKEESTKTTVSVLWQLYDKYRVELDRLPKLEKIAKEIEFPLIPVLARMEIIGIRLDSAYLSEMSERFDEHIKELEGLIYKEAGQEFNIASPQQLQTILFDKIRLPKADIKRLKSGYSTAASELEKLRHLHPIVDLISRYREVTKLKSTYVDALPKLVDKEGRLHTTFNQTITQTGRLSSDNPNLQNIPIRTDLGKEIRKAFVADPDMVLISADYAQFEPRLAAVLSHDTNMIHAFNKGIDIHAMTAAEIYDKEVNGVTKQERYNAKTVNFGVMYGMSPHGLSMATGMTHEDAKQFIDRYFKVRKPLLDYMESLKQKAKKEGYVESLFGRRRPMPDIYSPNFIVRSAAERAAINMPIQGTEADLMKMAMIIVDTKLVDGCKMLLQIHDSILVECPKDRAEQTAKMIKETMEHIYKLPVELDVEVSIGKHWGEL